MLKRQVRDVSQSIVFILNLPDACWKYNIVERNQSRRLRKISPDTAGQDVSKGGHPAGPVVCEQRRTGDMMAGGSLGHCDHRMTGHFIVGEVRRCASKTAGGNKVLRVRRRLRCLFWNKEGNNCKTNCSWGAQPLISETEEENEALMIQEEVVCYTIYTHTSLWGLKEPEPEPLSIIYQQSWLTVKIPVH